MHKNSFAFQLGRGDAKIKCIERGRHTLPMIKQSLIDELMKMDHVSLHGGMNNITTREIVACGEASTVATGQAMWLISIFNWTYL